MVEVLLDKPGTWLSGSGPEADLALRTRGMLIRNLADLPFASDCSLEEKRTIEERVLGVLESAGLLASGQYLSLANLDEREGLLLLERRLISESLLNNTGPRGVYVSNDQSLSIMVNEEDHLRVQVHASGLQPQEVFNRLNLLDNRLDIFLDYAFDERLGYLTDDLTAIGTGLQIDVVLHLPALYLRNRVMAVEQQVRDQHHSLEAVQGALPEARGDLYVLQNQRTLGRSEEEIAFHVKHLAAQIIEEERSARQTILAENPRALEDRVGRALGIARGARLLDYDEAVTLLSALRLGRALDLANGFSLADLNGLLIESQRAHIETKKGQDLDDLALSMERADLFRARFGQ